MEEWQQDCIHLQTNYYQNNYNELSWSGIPGENKHLFQAFIHNVLQDDNSVPRRRNQRARNIQSICNSIFKRYLNNACSINTILIIFFRQNFNCCYCNPDRTQRILHITDAIGNNFYIDPYCRVYKDWDNFLKTNRCPYGQLCYPIYGEYQTNSNGQVKCEFIENSKKYYVRNLIFSLLEILLIICIIVISGFIKFGNNDSSVNVYLSYFKDGGIGLLLFALFLHFILQYMDDKKHSLSRVMPTLLKDGS